MSRALRTIALALVLMCTAFAFADEAAKDSVTLNVKDDGVKKVEANQTQIGFASTRIFYTLGSQNAIVVMHIDNTNDKFPVAAKVYQFAKGVTADDLGKWVNNQHSDGLYPEVPEPTAVHEIKADAIKTVSSKRIGPAKGGPDNDSYDMYTVAIEAKTVEVKKNLQLGAFKDSATVYKKVPAER